MAKKVYQAPASVKLSGVDNEYGAAVGIGAGAVWAIGIGWVWLW